MSKLRLRCPKCQERLEINREDAGGLAECGACGKKFRLPPAPPPPQALAVVTPVRISAAEEDDEPAPRLADEDEAPDPAPRPKKRKRRRDRGDPWNSPGGLKDGVAACCGGLALTVIGIFWVAAQPANEKGEFTIPLYCVAGPSLFAFGVVTTLGLAILGPPDERRGLSTPHVLVRVLGGLAAAAVFAITAIVIHLH